MGAPRITDLTPLARGGGAGASPTQTRPLTARGVVAIAPPSEDSAMEVVITTVTRTYSDIIPAGNWSPRGSALPQVGDTCLVVYDDLGDAFVAVWGGASTVSAGLFSPGDLKLSAAGVTPAGWLVCDGSAYAQSDYSELFAALGGASSPWGHDSTHFNVPDLRGRVPIGAGTGTASDATAHALGAMGGTENTTLTSAQMPVHSHGGVTGTDSPDHAHTFSGNTGFVSNDHSHSWPGSGSNTPVTPGGAGALQSGGSQTGGISANHYHGFSGTTAGASARHQHGISSDGGGAAHTNMQPTTAINYLIKT